MTYNKKVMDDLDGCRIDQYYSLGCMYLMVCGGLLRLRFHGDWQ